MKTSDFPLLFSDDFNTNSAANWNIFWARPTVCRITSGLCLDYGVIPTFNGAASADTARAHPDGSTRGVRLAVNSDISPPTPL